MKRVISWKHIATAWTQRTVFRNIRMSLQNLPISSTFLTACILSNRKNGTCISSYRSVFVELYSELDREPLFELEFRELPHHPSHCPRTSTVRMTARITRASVYSFISVRSLWTDIDVVPSQTEPGRVNTEYSGCSVLWGETVVRKFQKWFRF